MKLYQLADDREVYGGHSGWWTVVSDDMEDELAGPFATREEAEKRKAALSSTVRGKEAT